MRSYIKYSLYILFISAVNLYCCHNINISNQFYSNVSSNEEIIDVGDIIFKDYSIRLSIIEFPMLSSFLFAKDKFLVLGIFLDIYEFMGYDKNVNTSVIYLNFFRTLKNIEYYFLEENKNISVSFIYSSSMSTKYNSFFRDLSVSLNRFYRDTHLLLSFNFYF